MDNKFGYYLNMKDELEYERAQYREDLLPNDWQYLLEESELFLVHAYTHLFKVSDKGYEVLGDVDNRLKYSQFYLNLAVGVELLLKAILLKKGLNINHNKIKTYQFSEIIENQLKCIFPKLKDNTIEDMRTTLKLLNEKRNNIAHRSKRHYDHYAYEHRFSWVILYIYEMYFLGHNEVLTGLLVASIKRSVVRGSMDFKPMRITPVSMRLSQADKKP